MKKTVMAMLLGSMFVFPIASYAKDKSKQEPESEQSVESEDSAEVEKSDKITPYVFTKNKKMMIIPAFMKSADVPSDCMERLYAVDYYVNDLLGISLFKNDWIRSSIYEKSTNPDGSWSRIFYLERAKQLYQLETATRASPSSDTQKGELIDKYLPIYNDHANEINKHLQKGGVVARVSAIYPAMTSSNDAGTTSNNVGHIDFQGYDFNSQAMNFRIWGFKFQQNMDAKGTFSNETIDGFKGHLAKQNLMAKVVFNKDRVLAAGIFTRSGKEIIIWDVNNNKNTIYKKWLNEGKSFNEYLPIYCSSGAASTSNSGGLTSSAGNNNGNINGSFNLDLGKAIGSIFQ